MNVWRKRECVKNNIKHQKKKNTKNIVEREQCNPTFYSFASHARKTKQNFIHPKEKKGPNDSKLKPTQAHINDDDRFGLTIKN